MFGTYARNIISSQGRYNPETKEEIKMRYKVIRNDRAAEPVQLNELLWGGADTVGLASEDSNVKGIEHISVSRSNSGIPFFTIPAEDVQKIDDSQVRAIA